MKTILVIYTNKKLTKKESQTSKRYAFNTNSPVKVADMFSCPDMYSTPMQVVEILPKTYKYVDVFSGELSNTRNPSTEQYEISNIKINKKPKARDEEWLEGVDYEENF